MVFFIIFVEINNVMETEKEIMNDLEIKKSAYVHPKLICPYDPESEYSRCCAPKYEKCTCFLKKKGTVGYSIIVN